MSRFERALLEGKKVMFTEKVKIISNILELDIPKIVFYEGYLPQGTQTRACIDIDSRTLYVSIEHLKIMIFEEIDETVKHELEHLLTLEHGSKFEQKIINLNSIFPNINTSGLVRIVSNSKKSINKNNKKVKDE